MKDSGPNPFITNIETATLENENYRTTLWTGSYMQLTVMAIQPGDSIGLETHEDHDQFLRIEQGEGTALLGDSKDTLEKTSVSDDDIVMVPAGKWHDIVNTGEDVLKVYSLYSPPEHAHGTVHPTKADADADEHDH